MERNVLSVAPNAPATEALSLMDNASVRVLPILDEERRCLALVSVFKASKFFFPAEGRAFDSRRVIGSLRSLTRALRGRMICAFEPDREEEFMMMIGAMRSASFGERLDRYPPERLLVLVGDRDDIQQLAIRARVRALVVTGGLSVSSEIMDDARRNEVSLIISPFDTATTAMLARAAVPVRHLQDEHFLGFNQDEPLRRIRDVATSSAFPAFPVWDDDKRVVGILTKSDFLKPPDRHLILVDHNELSQAVSGADEVNILEIIDHHRIGTLRTQQPILFRNEPVGSTSTIVADCFLRHGIEIPKPIAGALLAGLVSDTLNLTSPTTTSRDAEILARLEKASGVNAAEFTTKLFASGSILVSRAPAQAITADCKEYTEAGAHFSVAQIEELGFSNFNQRKAEVQEALEAFRRERGCLFSALLITDCVPEEAVAAVPHASACASSSAWSGNAARVRRDSRELERGRWSVDAWAVGSTAFLRSAVGEPGTTRRSVVEDAFEEAADGRGFGGGEELFGGAARENAALGDEGDFVGDTAGEAHLVRGEDEVAAFGAEFADHVENLRRHFGVEGGCRFVEEEETGARGKRASDRDALLLAA
jgi:manganese-dependent inorganic pyrophosphatase